MALADWHVPPDYIVNNWSEELFSLMAKKRNERIKAQPKPGENVRQITVRDLKPNYGEQPEGETE
ncbi:hypothetical protein LCGC14_2907390 [marine sediment metagenome]|uniref:Uncharacterized protein n=1 Tax=marine sediment metagenome TaxID=412755 RepID=A0A0F8XT07_9ZZZZ